MISIFALDTSLHIYKSQTDVQGLPVSLIKLEDISTSTESQAYTRLNLSDTFMSLFTSHVEEVKPKSCFLFIGDSAGFMNSRIVYLWLANLEFFTKVHYYVLREAFDEKIYKEQIANAIKEDRKDLAYSKEPNLYNQ